MEDAKDTIIASSNIAKAIFFISRPLSRQMTGPF